MTIGDSIGRLADPPSRARFEAVRIAMVDHLLENEARTRLSHAQWSSAFETAVGAIESDVMTEAARMVNAAAAFSRYPKRELQEILPTPAHGEALRNRLLAAGIPLERLETAADEAIVQRQRGVALETAWEGVLRVARDEVERWEGLSATIMAWRRGTMLLWVATAVLLVVAAVMAAWLGGQVEAPGWFEPIARGVVGPTLVVAFRDTGTGVLPYALT